MLPTNHKQPLSHINYMLTVMEKAALVSSENLQSINEIYAP